MLKTTVDEHLTQRSSPGRIQLRPNAGVLALAGLLALSTAQSLAIQAVAATAPAAKPAASGKAAHGDTKKNADGGDASKAAAGKAEKNAYDYNLPGPDGKDIPLSTYKGKYILVVNLARKSTYNDQLPALIKLNDTYKDKGLVVIGVPSNDFGAAEPGTDPEVLKAYADAKVDFPVMAVSKLSGDAELPFAAYLTRSKGAPAGGPIHWNFTKFVIDKKGNVVARLNPDVAPDSPEMLATIDQILDGTFKPPKKGGDKAGPPDDDDDE